VDGRGGGVRHQDGLLHEAHLVLVEHQLPQARQRLQPVDPREVVALHTPRTHAPRTQPRRRPRAHTPTAHAHAQTRARRRIEDPVVMIPRHRQRRCSAITRLFMRLFTQLSTCLFTRLLKESAFAHARARPRTSINSAAATHSRGRAAALPCAGTASAARAPATPQGLIGPWPAEPPGPASRRAWEAGAAARTWRKSTVSAAFIIVCLRNPQAMACRTPESVARTWRKSTLSADSRSVRHSASDEISLNLRRRRRVTCPYGYAGRPSRSHGLASSCIHVPTPPQCRRRRSHIGRRRRSHTC
jgi:hypothetical protein